MSTSEETAALPESKLGVARIASLSAVVRGLLFEKSEQAALRLGAATAFLVRVASAGILYLSQIVLARWMGGFEYGIYVFVWTWVLVLGGLSNLGLSTLVIRLVPEYRETGQFDRLRGLLRDGRIIPVTAATLVAGVAMGLLWFAGERVAAHYVLPVFIALFCVPMVTLCDVQDGIGRGRGWLTVALLPPYVLRPLLVLLCMVVAHELGWPMSAVTAAGAAVAGCWTTALVQTLLLQRRLGRDVAEGAAQSEPRVWLGASLPLLCITFSEVLVQNTDVLVISHYMRPEDAGMYFAAAKTMSLVMFVHYAVGSAVANRFAALNARGNAEALRGLVRQATNWTFWPSLAAAIAILALGRPLLWLFGPQFLEAYPVMFVLVIGYLGRSAMGPSELLLNMLGQQRAAAMVAVTTAACSIVLNLIVVPRFGLLGAASVTASCLVLGACLNTVVARRRLGLSIAIWSNAGRG